MQKIRDHIDKLKSDRHIHVLLCTSLDLHNLLRCEKTILLLVEEKLNLLRFTFILLIELKSLLLSFDGISLAGRGPIVEKWSLKALEGSLELEIMEPFNSNTFTVVLLVRREVSSLMVCHVFRKLPLD